MDYLQEAKDSLMAANVELSNEEGSVSLVWARTYAVVAVAAAMIALAERGSNTGPCDECGRQVNWLIEVDRSTAPRNLCFECCERLILADEL